MRCEWMEVRVQMSGLSSACSEVVVVCFDL